MVYDELCIQSEQSANVPNGNKKGKQENDEINSRNSPGKEIQDGNNEGNERQD